MNACGVSQLACQLQRSLWDGPCRTGLFCRILLAPLGIQASMSLIKWFSSTRLETGTKESSIWMMWSQSVCSDPKDGELFLQRAKSAETDGGS